MNPVHPEFVPDASATREDMESLQREVAAAANWTDDFAFDPAAASLRGESGDGSAAGTDADQTALTADFDGAPEIDEAPLVAGVDQAFLDDRAVSVVVVSRGRTVVERVHAVTDLEIPYIPGLLSFREGGSILAAFAELEREPDLVVFDGSGRIHFRQAGLATHLGVTLDVPSVGVAKSLLCGRPESDVDGRPEGWRTPILADERVENAEAGEKIGHAVQSRQYESRPIINPLYVSPGHRVSVDTAADLVEGLCDGYKLPEPTRLADARADEVKREYADDPAE